MGDIHCPTCGEPWDSYHLMHDAIWDAPDGEVWGPIWKSEQAEGRNPMKFPGMRPAMEADGWQFAGDSALAIIRCPSCPKEKETDKNEAAIRAELTALLGDDEDGLQAELEDLSYFE